MKTFAYHCPCCGNYWTEEFEDWVMEYDDEAIGHCCECDKEVSPEDEDT